MLRICIVTLLVVGVFSMSILDGDLDQEWDRFKQQYNKIYENPDVDFYRRTVWEDNLYIIAKHNKEAEEGIYTYTLGENEYADRTNEEFVKAMNGYKKGPKKTTGNVFIPQYNVEDLPKTVDWRTKGYVTPVKNQGGCGSCWAFATTGTLEGQHFRKTGRLISLSEQNLVDCSRKEGCEGCGGGYIDWALTYIEKNHGVDTEKSYPYHGVDQKCTFNNATVGATVTGFTNIKNDSEADLQIAVATVGPIGVTIDASDFQLYKKGVYNPPSCSTTALDHCVLAVGYGVLKGTDYWLVKNSWGASWGMDGYILMSRNKNNQCGIASLASYPLV